MKCSYCGNELGEDTYYSYYWSVDIALFCTYDCVIKANEKLMEVKKSRNARYNNVDGDQCDWSLHVVRYNYYLG